MSKIIKVYFELSFRCNLKCKFCYAWDIQNKENIWLNYFDFKSKYETINYIKKIFCDDWYLYDIDILWWESLLNKDFIDLIFYITNNFNIRNINLTTNATLLNKELILSLLKVWITHFRVSLHWLEIKHNYLVWKDVFNKVIESLIILSELKCNIIIIFVYNNINKSDLLELIIFLKNNKIKYWDLFIEFVEFSWFWLKNIKELNLLYNRKLKKYFNKQLNYIIKINSFLNIAISNFPKCMLDDEFHKCIDDNFNQTDNFGLYFPLLTRKTFQSFWREELNIIINSNIEKWYKKSCQLRIDKKFIQDKCITCEYNKNCYLLITENILYDYLWLETHKRKHYFEINNIIVWQE
jgi:MoaA/NifB/PqqE/SkfB family radical SAM enzyme